MNPIFVFLVLLIGFLVWLLGTWLYRPIGTFVKRLIWNVQDAIDKDEEEKAIEKYIKERIKENE